MHVADAVAGYIVDAVRATREQPGLAFGASLRATLALTSLCHAWASQLEPCCSTVFHPCLAMHDGRPILGHLPKMVIRMSYMLGNSPGRRA